MKKKLALLMAAIMTVAMVPMTAFASTKVEVYDAPIVAEDTDFSSPIELNRNNHRVDVVDTVTVGENAGFEVVVKLANGKFTKFDEDSQYYGQLNQVGVKLNYEMERSIYLNATNNKTANSENIGILKIDVLNDTTAVVTLAKDVFNNNYCVLDIKAKGVEAGSNVTATITGPEGFTDVPDLVIAKVAEEAVDITVDGVTTFVEGSTRTKAIKDITINGLTNSDITENKKITLKLKGDYKFVNVDDIKPVILNNSGITLTPRRVSDTEVELNFNGAPSSTRLTNIIISNIQLEVGKKATPVETATITVSSKQFDSVKLEVAKLVEEAVTYTVEDDDLPTIWAGKDYGVVDAKLDGVNTLKVSVEENTGDILNTSRKATFTFPEGIEVVGVKLSGTPVITTSKDVQKDDIAENLEIDENVVTIRNYQKKAVAESNADKGKTDMDIEFVLNAAPTFSGDVTVTLGGEFDDVEFKVATVKAPYTIEAKTSEVLIDYRYVPVNEIVITEAEEGILAKNEKITLEVEKMDFEDAGSYDVTEGDIDVDVDVKSGDKATLEITVKDDSTEASTIVISGLELYLDRTLPVGGYALWNTKDNNILWENSRKNKTEGTNGYDQNGLFKYKEVTCNDSYVEVVTQARDQDDYTTNRKIVITIGATTMAVGTETVTLDAPAYINAENYTELPLRAVSEAFGATVAWDDASRTVTVMMGQRIVSMTIGSKTMYINGTPVAMNTAPEITADRTFVPVRDLANALGISKIDWNEAAATVTLN